MAYKSRLTDKQIDALPVKAEGYEVNLGLPGYCINVWPSGSRVFTLRYRDQKKRNRKRTIGARPENNAAEMFDKALDWRRDIRDGRDPHQDHVAALEAQKREQADTVAGLLPKFIERECDGLRSQDEIERVLTRHLLPALGDRPLKSIARRDVEDLLHSIRKRSGRAMETKSYAHIRKFFYFAEDQELLDKQPCARIRTSRPVPRERVFSNAEYKALWRASALLSPVRAAYFRTLMLLGQRRSEVATMTWQEIDRSQYLWEIPGAKMKAGKPHLVPLSPVALGMLDETRLPGCRYVFPSSRDSSKPLSGFVDLKRQLVKALAKVTPDLAATMPQWCLHDIRRSMRTELSKLGIDAELAERLIAHVPHGVRAIYDRHSFLPEKAQAMRAWQAKLAEITGDDTLRPVPRLVASARAE